MIAKKLTFFFNFLKKVENLPGHKSHVKLSPILNGKPFRKFQPIPGAKQSAVMILLSQTDDDSIKVLLTVRSSMLKSHSGQISFPGGRIEPDETPLDAAIRETEEEIGIKAEDMEIITELSSIYVPPSNSLIYTFIAQLNSTLFEINTDEVEEIIMTDLDFLANNENIIFENRKIDGTDIVVPCWNLNRKEVLWGATAMILSELIDLYKEFLAES